MLDWILYVVDISDTSGKLIQSVLSSFLYIGTTIESIRLQSFLIANNEWMNRESQNGMLPRNCKILLEFYQYIYFRQQFERQSVTAQLCEFRSA
jgi:hypothetical protein